VTQGRSASVLSSIRQHSALVRRRALQGTMLRNDPRFSVFPGLGLIERADNNSPYPRREITYVLLPTGAPVSARTRTNVQWRKYPPLRLRGTDPFHWLNRLGTPTKSDAEFPLLDARMPRSLALCYDETDCVSPLENDYWRPPPQPRSFIGAGSRGLTGAVDRRHHRKAASTSSFASSLRTCRASPPRSNKITGFTNKPLRRCTSATKTHYSYDRRALTDYNRSGLTPNPVVTQSIQNGRSTSKAGREECAFDDQHGNPRAILIAFMQAVAETNQALSHSASAISKTVATNGLCRAAFAVLSSLRY